MPPFIQPTAFFSPPPPSPAPASSSPPYPAPVRPLPSSPNHGAASTYPLPPSPTSSNSHLPSQSSIHSAVYSLPTSLTTNIHSQRGLNNPYIHPLSTSTFRIHPTTTTTSSSNLRVPIAKRKPEGPETTMELAEPQRKVHLSEELVAQNMADLHISYPRAKVARRNVNNDVAEAMNLSALEGLEKKFSQAPQV